MSANTHSTAMDYNEHNRTYSLFIDGTKVGIILCLNIVVSLVFVHLGAPVLASLYVVVALITMAIGLAVRPNGVMVGAVQFVLGLLGMALLAA